MEKQRGGDLGWAAPLGSGLQKAEAVSSFTPLSGKGENKSSLVLSASKSHQSSWSACRGRSLPTPGPCSAASFCAATGEVSISAAESYNFSNFSSPQQLNHAMCSGKLAGKAVDGGSAS